MDTSEPENTARPFIPTFYGLNRGWHFRKDKAPTSWLKSGTDETGETITLPHCWNEHDTFQQNVSCYRGFGSYRKSFSLPAGADRDDDAQWILSAGGFYGRGSLWLNGRKVANVNGQYLGFEINMTDRISKDGPNLLGIRIDNKYHRNVLPGFKMPDFLLYGGLAGGIGLRRLPSLHLRRGSTHIRTANVRSGTAHVKADARVENMSGRERYFRVHWSIQTEEGDIVAEAASQLCIVEPGGCADLSVELNVANSNLWDTDNPFMYKAIASIEESSRIVDWIETSFGFREAEFRENEGFFLNGRRVHLHGCNRHEAIPGFGNALPPELHRRDAEILKEYGFNFVRLSHYPQSPDFLDACDRLGILVYAEIATWKSVRNGRWLDAARRQMEGMIRRDRNHPSVILWGMGNESRSRRAYTELRELAREMDGSRPTIYAENMLVKGAKAGTLDIPDVLGLNYKLENAEPAKNASRNHVVLASECSNFPRARRGDPSKEEDQIRLIKRHLSNIEGKDFVAGYCLWCFADYATERKKRYIRHSGVVDAWRLPKRSAAWHRSLVRGDIDLDTPRPVEDGERTVECVANTIGFVSNLPDTVPGGTVIVLDVQITDEQCEAVTDWSGSARIEVSGCGKAKTYREDNAIEISGGLGRVYVASDNADGTLRINVSAMGLGSCETELSVRRQIERFEEL